MKTISLSALLLLLFISTAVIGQNVGDCNGGIIMCDDFYSEQNAPVGFGTTQEFVGNCNSGFFGENNSIWYIFTIDNSGFMNFTLTPNNPNDDYDWAVINITDGGCAGINNMTSPVVSCNSFGLIGINGPTGISSANGGVGNNNGPGNLNGPAFNENLNVLAGQTYALCVMNWSGSPSGYTLDFGGSSASFYDDEAPVMTAATYDCSNGQVAVSFNENILLGTVESSDFELSGPQGSISAIGITAVAGSQSQFVIQLASAVNIGGDYQINITNTSGFVTDACGNESIAPFSLTLPDGIQFDVATTIACQGVNGAITVSNITGGTGPFALEVDGISQNNLTVSGLAAGNYQVTITDSQGCISQSDVNVPGQNVAVDIPPQQALSCSITELTLAGVAVVPLQNVDFSWSSLDGSIISGDNTANPTVNQPGQYSVILTNTDNGCTAVGSVQIINDNSVQISINFGPDVALCEGETLLLDATQPLATYTWQDGTIGSTFLVASEGTYSVTAVNGDCTGGDQITVSYVPTLFSTVDVNICQGSTYMLPSGNEVTQAGDYVSNMTMPGTGCPHIITTNVSLLSIFTTYLYHEMCEGQTHTLPNGQIADLSGSYPVIFEADNGCDSTVVTQLVVHPLPSFSFDWLPIRPYLQDPLVQFSVQTLGEAQYQWQFADLGNSEGSSTEFLFPNDRPGFYEVCATATSPFGCLAMECRTVGIYSQMNFWCPNAFTPNSDETNDVFKPVVNGHDPDDYLFEVFDRWGQKVFSTVDPEMGWTGNHTGGDFYVQNDLYFWRVKVQPLGIDNRQIFTGHVLFLR